jgi:hypothetical protein
MNVIDLLFFKSNPTRLDYLFCIPVLKGLIDRYELRGGVDRDLNLENVRGLLRYVYSKLDA